MKREEKRLSYPQTRKIINSAFEHGPAFQVMNINMALSQKIDWKNAQCAKKCPGHKSATVFFRCCANDFTVLSNGIEPMVLSKDGHFNDKVNKWINDHIKNKEYPPNFEHLHFELLIVNIFNIKTTISTTDLEIVFEFVYGIKLDSLCDYKKYILAIESENLKFNNTKTKIIITPVNDSLYKYSNNEDLFKFIKRPGHLQKQNHDSSLSSLGNQQKKIINTKEQLSRLSISGREVKNDINHHIKNKTNPVIESKAQKKKRVAKQAFKNKCLRIADMNVPKSLIETKLNPSNIFHSFNDEEGLDEKYFYITGALSKK